MRESLGSGLSDDALGDIVREIVASFDDWPRPLLPTIRREFNLCLADAVIACRAAAATVARHEQIPDTADGD